MVDVIPHKSYSFAREFAALLSEKRAELLCTIIDPLLEMLTLAKMIILARTNRQISRKIAQNGLYIELSKIMGTFREIDSMRKLMDIAIIARERKKFEYIFDNSMRMSCAVEQINELLLRISRVMSDLSPLFGVENCITPEAMTAMINDNRNIGLFQRMFLYAIGHGTHVDISIYLITHHHDKLSQKYGKCSFIRWYIANPMNNALFKLLAKKQRYIADEEAYDFIVKKSINERMRVFSDLTGTMCLFNRFL